MNFHRSSIFLGFIIFVLKTLDARRLENGIDERPDARSRHRYFKLYPLQIKQYHKLFNRPFSKRHFSVKNKKHPYDDRPFVDLTRDEDLVETLHFGDASKFSEDYIDISELARHAKDADKVVSERKPDNKKIVIDIHGNTHKVLEMLNNLARRYQPFQQRSNFNSDTETSSSNSKESTENTKTTKKSKTQLRNVPKRFQVVNNNAEMVSDDDKNYVAVDTSSDFDNDESFKTKSESSSDESSTDGVINELLYIQSPTRHLKTSEMDWRKRLPHFLPKRMHWTERDLQDLSNYWNNGPRGKFPALYKTPY